MTILIRFASLILISSSLVSTADGAAQTTPTDLNKSIDLSVGSHVKVERLLINLQASVAKHDPAAVAALVHYPIKVNPGKHPITIKTPKAFIKDYDSIITHDISDVILKQKYEALFVNSQGVMLGDGEVWITGFCLDKNCKNSDIKIGTIQDTKNLNP
jgi:hypothetical protein